MAIKTYKKGTVTQLSTNFKSTEFDCHGSGCCSSTQVDEDLVKYLQKIRDHFGKSVNISSGYRCATHNKNVGGATGSRHAKGQAADIYISGVKPAEIAKYAESIGILGIGLYETNADGHFVHVDTRTTKSFWYGQAQAKRTTFGGAIITEDKKEETSSQEMYRVRKAWTNAKSQIGAYTVFQNAKNACDRAGAGYYVFNSSGEVLYPKATDTQKPVNTASATAADPKIIWDFLKKQGLNDYGVAGLMGNLYAESGLKPCNLQNTYEKSLGMSDMAYTEAVDNGTYTNFVNDKAGYGLAQWTYYTRKQAMLDYHKKANASIGDLNTQLQFLMYELNKNYTTSVLKVLKEATSILEASNAVLLKFERPADQSTAVQTKRAEYGQKYYNDYHIEEQKPTISVPVKGENGNMKYSESNKPLVCMQTQSTCYKGTTTMNVRGILWHSTGANNPNLKRYVQPSDNAPDRDAWLKLLGTNTYKNDWNHITHQAGLNCWIGKLADGTVTTVQTMPWNYKPWGCGSGSKGSCNNGWIQFEICEDGLTDKAYFEKVYKEACEITAYLCKMYNIDPKGTVSYNGVTVPTILCHQDSYRLGLGSNHGDVLHWFPKHGKSMDDVRNDVAALISSSGNIATKPNDDKTANADVELYRVRKAWTDVQSQIGAYKDLKNAKEARDIAGSAYFVFDSKGNVIYPETAVSFAVGDTIKLVDNAKYTSGKSIPDWVIKSKLYVREIRNNGNIVFSTQKTGDVTGVTAPKYVYKEGEKAPSQDTSNTTFTPYLVKINTDVLNVRAGAGTSYKITTQVKRNGVYTIVNKSGDWGKLKSGAGWINLSYTEKI